jgi:acetolactate synthase small subunit
MKHYILMLSALVAVSAGRAQVAVHEKSPKTKYAFTLASPRQTAAILYDASDAAVVKRAAELFAADVEAVPLEQIIKQLNKLLHVLKIVELDPNTTVERELVLIKVAANESNRSDVLEIVRLFRVRVVDVNPESLTIEATGAEGKIDALLGLLEHYGVIELVRSGAVAVTRGPKALSEKVIGSEIKGR